MMSSLLTAARPLSVLVVDDCEAAADSLALVLVLCGLVVRVVTSGAAALVAARVNPPDAVVLDLMMPGMDGWELARRLRDQSCDKRPFLVALTECRTEEARRRSADAGIDLHLLRPADPALVVGVLERFAQMLAAGSGR
jgi:CheY-like chemotaxis protein